MTLPLVLTLLYLVVGWYLSLFVRGTDWQNRKSSLIGFLANFFGDGGLLELFFVTLWPIWAPIHWWPWKLKK